MDRGDLSMRIVRPASTGAILAALALAFFSYGTMISTVPLYFPDIAVELVASGQEGASVSGLSLMQTASALAMFFGIALAPRLIERLGANVAVALGAIGWRRSCLWIYGILLLLMIPTALVALPGRRAAAGALAEEAARTATVAPATASASCRWSS